jgi:hypothetical protein
LSTQASALDGEGDDDGEDSDDSLPDLSHVNPRDEDLAAEQMFERAMSDLVDMYSANVAEAAASQNSESSLQPTKVLAPDTPSPVKSTRKRVILTSKYFASSSTQLSASKFDTSLVRALDVEFSSNTTEMTTTTMAMEEDTTALLPQITGLGASAAIQASLESDTTLVNSDGFAEDDVSPLKDAPGMMAAVDAAASRGTLTARNTIDSFCTFLTAITLALSSFSMLTWFSSVSSVSAAPSSSKDKAARRASAGPAPDPSEVICLNDDDDDDVPSSSSTPSKRLMQLEDGTVIQRFEEVTDSQGFVRLTTSRVALTPSRWLTFDRLILLLQ